LQGEGSPFFRTINGKQGVMKLTRFPLRYQNFSVFVAATPSAIYFLARHAKGL
jgi:hypothetical protein